MSAKSATSASVSPIFRMVARRTRSGNPSVPLGQNEKSKWPYRQEVEHRHLPDKLWRWIERHTFRNAGGAKAGIERPKGIADSRQVLWVGGGSEVDVMGRRDWRTARLRGEPADDHVVDSSGVEGDDDRFSVESPLRPYPSPRQSPVRRPASANLRRFDSWRRSARSRSSGERRAWRDSSTWSWSSIGSILIRISSPTAARIRSTVEKAGSAAPDSIRATVDCATPAASARSRWLIRARIRARVTRAPATVFRGTRCSGRPHTPTIALTLSFRASAVRGTHDGRRVPEELLDVVLVGVRRRQPAGAPP